MTDGFEVISPGLFITDVGVDGGISGGTCEVLSISEGNVLTV
jgi:hypothetical protein